MSLYGEFRPALIRPFSWNYLRGGASSSATVIFASVCLALALFSLGASGQVTEPALPPETTVQLVGPPAAGEAGPPLTLTLKDALERARKNDVGYLSAAIDARNAHEDRAQARAALLPTVSETTQELLTQGNGKLPSGRYVTNDGIHVYREWAVFHQDLSPGALKKTGLQRASAAEALAQARQEVASRGLVVTVTRNYYGLVVAQRKYASAQENLDQARRLLEITQQLEQGGAAAHSDVIKAQIQYDQQKTAFEEARLGMEGARVPLSVLLFPDLNENFSVVDDLQTVQVLPPFSEVQSMARRENPDVRAAMEAMRQASLDVSLAHNAFLPSLTLDVDYGLEANVFGLHGRVSASPESGRLPTVGFFATANLSLPVWDWGTLRSRLHQAENRRELANAQLSLAQRQLMGNLYSFYNEAAVSRSEVESLRDAATQAAESFRLTTLRYKLGEATILEFVDALNTLVTVRNSYDDVQARYRVALANLQTLTGNF